ncbi:keratin-associated protein family, partial [Trichomonas vaginalis G3]
MIENSQLTFKEDTLYNALNAAFAYILGHEQVQNSGIAIYLDKVMLKKPLTFTEDGPKATGIVGDGTLLTKEYLASHVGEFFSTNDSISTTPEVILLKKPITFDVKGKTKATGIAGDGVLLTKEYLKKNINDFVEIVKDKESGLKFNPLSFIFAIANAGATAASWISLQSQINALWAFVESQEGIDTVLDTLGNLGPNHKGGFVDGIKNLVEKTKTSFQKITHIERFRNEGYMELESFDVTGPLEPIPMPRDANDEEEKDPGPKTIISTLSTLYPDFVTLVKVANTSRKNNNINMSGTDDLTDYLYLILA